ncbi:39S ribosomal protein L3, mitochondrial-like [Acanthaster planci]|uniref:Large ribosomal subunit protein uL3m n=1 Tax=Acanthaster planci TaxID=133434 RepID=A0A8B7ZYU8_ACAPL|nr:39S ribosomal protein L3, mitochondrial-like [Acanthaster planci]
MQIVKMAAPMVITRVIQLVSKNSLLNARERLTRLCSCAVQRRTYYEYDTEYDTDIPKDLEDIVNKWSRVKNTLGPSPLKDEPWPHGEWEPGRSKRCGLVAVKLGMMPVWTKSGQRLTTTVLQVLENSVVKYTPPEENTLNPKYGCLLVGARNADPFKKSLLYSEQFKEAGLPVKDKLTSFKVSSNAKIQPGTPLHAAHFRPGMYVDCCGRTIDKGFQGVMKRWGMKGQPASHGVTKTHRKMGATGGGGTPGRIWPGKKMPGHMGNKMRWTLGLKVLRVNMKHNILYVGGSVAGHKFGYIKVIDSILPKNRDPEVPPPFPTYYEDEELEENLLDEELFDFNDPSIAYPEEAES